MSTLSVVVMSAFFILLVFLIVIKLANRIPKTGRSNEASGEKIEAIITNENRVADKPATMRLVDKDGNKYKVKMKADEARMWIKGDTAQILLSDVKGKYRVLFNDYFRQNEERIREYAAEKMKKSVKTWFISSRLTGYTEKSPEALINSEADSRILFMFMTYMRMINTYSIVAFLFTVLFLSWRGVYSPGFSDQVFPFVVLLVVYLMIYGAVMTCKNILKKYSQ